VGANLSRTLRVVRKARGLTQAQLAEKAQLRRTDVNALENGRIAAGPERLRRLADALEVSVLELAPQPADARGQVLLDRLESLEAEVASSRADGSRALGEVVRRLADLEDALALLAQQAVQTRPRTSEDAR
jgi:transcriptional regulator with XRE-family HTH domain